MPNDTRVGGAVGVPRVVPDVATRVAASVDDRAAEEADARLAVAQSHSMRWRLPVGLTEPELQQGYSRVPHPVEVVAMGFLVACAAACALGVWPWPLVAVRGLS